MRETFEEARSRIMERIRAANDWVCGAEEWIEICRAKGEPQSSGFINSLLGFFGPRSEMERAQENLNKAHLELKDACQEWDDLNRR